MLTVCKHRVNTLLTKCATEEKRKEERRIEEKRKEKKIVVC